MSRPAKPPAQPAAASHLKPGLVVASFGRHCLVESADGERRICHPRGKKSQVVVGDRVQWSASTDEGSVERVDERRNLFYRQDELRTKSFAANLDQILMLVAADPEFSERQLARALIAAEAQNIPVIVVLNKSDLQPAFDRSWARLAPYRHMGVDVMPLRLKAATAASSEAGVEDLLQKLNGKSTLILGPSGVGKSTLVNRLVPHAAALTGEISRALNSGKHTTTSTTWYWTDDSKQTALIDSPGFQEFGLNHIEPMQLAQLMPDMRAALGNCRFYNCTHLHEPGCSVRDQVAKADEPPSDTAPAIGANRYQIYGELFAELSDKRRY
ncbi:ribosome small subunit-dependent GTPase A [Hydrogenophaga crassostreae]|uniref:Small ribosomal subunit biogenesis GTPase RsgA n=1 Tax=Hydrogenophaga crassostreae TaxID=1763535 RepID=A0A162YVN8_9BURK|nr:ribosome small subunit-dependent GTPase A [Hydrogenophaga crassostreae]AOW12624.1 ribosome small subunit-dependent GTPase A [Hydrogenophaga crassostreae]OAD40495.1 ribosome small subunit-dependent GTPase A [Hydrogenophaga crassostreae]